MKAGSSPECVARSFADFHEPNKSEQKIPNGPKCGRDADQLPAKNRIESGTHPPDAKPAIKETIGSKHTLTKKIITRRCWRSKEKIVMQRSIPLHSRFTQTYKKTCFYEHP